MAAERHETKGKAGIINHADPCTFQDKTRAGTVGGGRREDTEGPRPLRLRSSGYYT